MKHADSGTLHGSTLKGRAAATLMALAMVLLAGRPMVQQSASHNRRDSAHVCTKSKESGACSSVKKHQNHTPLF